MSVAGGRVAVVVPSWNGQAHLARCLPALAAQTYADHEVVVVDNGSTDGSTTWLAEVWPGVRCIAVGANLGFAAACNRGIAAGATPWVALLNNDTVPDPGWLASLVECAGADGRLAAVASLMLFLDAPEMINSAGIAVDPSGIAWDRLGGAPVADGATAAAVFGASAGAGLFRRAALDDVAEAGPDGRVTWLDEHFFMFMEDVDLAWRLRLAGWRAAYAPGARVLHAGSASAGEGSPFKNRLLARNKIWTVVKNYPSRPLLWRWPLVLAYDLASVPFRYLTQQQLAALGGRMAALPGLPRVLAQRRRIQSRRRVGWPEIAPAMAPLAAPWAVPARYRHLRPRYWRRVRRDGTP